MKKTAAVDDSFKALAAKAAASASSSKALTLTDEFGRDVFSKYMELRQAGASGNKMEQQLFIDELLSDTKYTATPRTYTDKELLVKMDSGKASLELYSTQIGTIFRQNVINSRDEGVIVKDALTKEDPTILRELDPIIASYKAILQKLIETPAPQPLFMNHKNLVNSLSSLVFISESLRKVTVDPVIGIQAVGRIQSTSKSLYDALQTIKLYMENAGVPFILT